MSNVISMNRQKVENGAEIIISKRKFTIEMYEGVDTIYMVGTRGGLFFLRAYTNDETLFQVVAANSGVGEGLRNKSGKKLHVTINNNILTDITE